MFNLLKTTMIYTLLTTVLSTLISPLFIALYSSVQTSEDVGFFDNLWQIYSISILNSFIDGISFAIYSTIVISFIIIFISSGMVYLLEKFIKKDNFSNCSLYINFFIFSLIQISLTFMSGYILGSGIIFSILTSLIDSIIPYAIVLYTYHKIKK